MLAKLKKYVVFYKWAILSGVMIGTTYIPFPPWALFFCFVPLWLFWLKHPSCLKTIVLSGFITQFLLTLIGFNWVAHTLREFGHLPWPAAILGLLLFCGFANLHIPLAGAAWFFSIRKFRLKPLSQIVLISVYIGLFELIYPMIFDWHFGYTWYWAGLPGIQTAEIWGTKFLSTLSIFLNVFFLIAWTQRKQLKKCLYPLGLALAIFIGVNLFGVYLKHRLPSTDKYLHALVVQANIGNLEKQYAEQGAGFRNYIANQFFQLTKKGIAEAPEGTNIDFAVWPETAFPVQLNPSGIMGGLGLQLRRFIKDNQIALFTGSYGLTKDADGISNSLFYFNKDGEVLSPTYTKTTLLAFGEYIPGGDWFPIVYQWLPQVAHFSRGSGPVIQTLADLKIGPQICYEGLFDHFSRGSAQLGSQVLINVTNDSWYGTWQQPYQHLYMTLSRAIEIRRPLIRSTNTGISTVVLANGEVLSQSPLHQKWTHLYKVPYDSSPSLTLFSKWGYWFPYIFLSLLGVIIFGIQRSRTD